MTSEPHPQRSDSESTSPPHPLLQHPEFLPSNSFDSFWNDTWGKPYSEVFTPFEYGGRPYNPHLSLSSATPTPNLQYHTALLGTRNIFVMLFDMDISYLALLFD
ncbi:hypothetical protein K435DRAFT_872461 [Dendrothele bispora CBS 962.96]|uniref:Uncharacterized protein n=1 Tax=Dendrothele bispora (strain CBS 962.96) TaxID=1314807 RepID=A0A4S8L1Q6_DENBC|nr:hypothetical protein K435DRAFT_872461 [Dendrothele bispora CBS 962.96]